MNSPLEALAPHFRHISVATIGLAALLAATDDARAQWAYATTKDAMRGTVATRADLTSRNTHQFSFPYHGGSRLKLIVWSAPDNADADLRQTVGLFITRGQFRCLQSDVCPIHIKVDDGPVEPLSAQLSDDFGLMWLYSNGVQRIIEATATGRTLSIEVPIYQHGERQYSFRITPLRWKN